MPLEFAFQSPSLRAICEREAEAKRVLPPAVVEKLKHRLADLRAAKSVHDIFALPGKPAVLADSMESIVISLGDGYILLFCANHVANPKSPTGQMEWAQVTRVKILKVGTNIDDG